MEYLYLFFANIFYEKICSIWCGIFTCTYIIEILVWLEILASFWDWVVVIFYSQMQELRTTFFWLLIASHLALFKRILQTTYRIRVIAIRAFYFPKWLFGAHSIWILSILFKKIVQKEDFLPKNAHSIQISTRCVVYSRCVV